MRTARFSEGVSAQRGWCLSAQGVYNPAHCILGYTPHVNRITDRCKYITLPQLRLRVVIMKEFLQIGIVTHFGVIPLFSIRAVSLTLILGVNVP